MPCFNRFPAVLKKRPLLAGLVSISLALSCVAPAMANCEAELQKTMSALDSAKQKALRNEPLDAQAFSRQLQPTLEQMQRKQCANELMQLMQYIQMEQQAYPAPPGTVPAIPGLPGGP